MKMNLNSLLLFSRPPILIVALLLCAGRSLADTPTQIYSFGNAPDGAGPASTLFRASDGFLYGTAGGGGATGYGTVFRISLAGAFHLVYSFTNGLDGEHPAASPKTSELESGTWPELLIAITSSDNDALSGRFSPRHLRTDSPG